MKKPAKCIRSIGCLALLALAFAVVYQVEAVAQQSGGALQEKLAVIKQAAAANQQALRHYS